MRVTEPTTTGVAHRDGADIHVEIYERDAPTILLLPTWEIIDSRQWKGQVPYLARHFRVVRYDAAGTGQSSKPMRPERYSHANRMADALAVLDATQTERAVAVGFSAGGSLALLLAAFHPERLHGAVPLAAGHPRFGAPPGRPEPAPWDPDSGDPPQEWASFDLRWWNRDWESFLHWFMTTINSDPHSTKIVDEGMEWASEQVPEIPWWSIQDSWDLDVDDWYDRLATCQVPTLLIHGDADTNTDYQASVYLSQTMPKATLHTVPGADHPVNARFPVLFNHLVHDFAAEVTGAPSRPTLHSSAYVAPASDRRKVLYLSSPIGLGHARRDVAIAESLQASHPGLTIDWLAQDPVTRVLEASGHRIHPASALLASESARFEADCGDHALDAFESVRDMNDVLVHNFHIMNEAVAEGGYDLVIGDEAWDTDHHLHENPSLKRAQFAWLTDFVGFVPMPAGGERQAAVTADYNLEMIEHIDRHPHLRDRAVFVGDPEDIAPGTLGPGLPGIREWTQAHFDFAGYVTGFDPRNLGDRDKLRASIGFKDTELVCVVSVGGTGVGRRLIERIVAAAPQARAAIPQLRMVVVTGPRIDPATLPHVDGVEYHSYVDRLYRWLAACDVAIVQGGLTTTMELTAAKVPFIYVPLRDHFEQNVHVHARLQRYGAGMRMDYDSLTPAAVASAIHDLLSSTPDYLDVATDGAHRAARMIGELL
ncbi:alpha/beta fold hydrolase [Demequina sp. B12]|uniref:alpha/beta hydrolase n=1 Tax=Demequina sp. B12 TaxID=2992757 RepID=UPI00237B2303|nr:alpha/beta fold hydrolase [Demequina sp. B12]MDE0573481.1 alpha/beta fold hydrolase [Demequina sp. B12]